MGYVERFGAWCLVLDAGSKKDEMQYFKRMEDGRDIFLDKCSTIHVRLNLATWREKNHSNVYNEAFKNTSRKDAKAQYLFVVYEEKNERSDRLKGLKMGDGSSKYKSGQH